MFCIYCGNQCSDSAKFCAKCGKSIVRLPVEEAVVKEPEAAAEEAAVKEPEAAAEEAAVKEPEAAAEEAAVKEPEAAAEEAAVEEPEAAAEEAAVKEPEAVAEEAAVEEATVKEPEAAKPTKKAKKVKKETVAGKIAAHFFSVLWTLVLIALCLALLLKITCDGALGDFNTSGILDAVELKEVPVGEFVSSIEIADVDIEDDDNLSDVVYELIQSETRLDVTKSQVDKLLDEIMLNDFFNELKDDYLKVAVGEKKSAHVKPDQVIRFIEDNKRVLEKSLDVEITERDLVGIENYLEKIDIEEATMVRMPEETRESVQKLQMVFKQSMVWNILIILGIVVIAGLLLLTNLRKKRRAVLYAGCGVTIAACAGCVLAMMTGQLVAMVASLDKDVLNNLLAGVNKLLTKNALFFLSAGIAFILVFVVCEIIVRVTANKKVD